MGAGDKARTAGMIDMDNRKILLIHLGGLGDMCLSESTFLSLSRHFEGNIEALGYTRFFNLFQEYFSRIHSIESIKWLHLFSNHTPEIKYKRIIFIGKDREGALRKRWQGFSEEPLIFIEMYPEDHPIVPRTKTIRDRQGSRFTVKSEPVTRHGLRITGSIHVEDYQLAQLSKYDVKAVKKDISPKPTDKVILYPEPVFRKEKWSHENFVKLYRSLKLKGIAVHIVEALGLELDIKEKVFFQDLTEVKKFFQNGGVFVSNDSGMAHLAGICGLFTITIFSGFDPFIWHPRGRGITLEQEKDGIEVASLERKILETMEGNR